MVGCKRISDDEEIVLKHVLCDEVELESWEENSYVGVLVDKKVYIGLLTDAHDEEREADVMLLDPPLPSCVFSWPSEMRSFSIPYPHIICYVDVMEYNNENKYNVELGQILALKQKGNIRYKSLSKSK